MGNTMMERCRALRCYTESTFSPEHEKTDRQSELELSAFMSIFHPSIRGKRLKKIMRARKRVS